MMRLPHQGVHESVPSLYSLRDTFPRRMDVLHDEFIVDTILDFRISHSVDRSHNGPCLEFLKHWDGYDTTHDSWKPYVNLKHVEALHDFARFSLVLARLFRQPTYLHHHGQYPVRFPLSIP
jgi:hypothetical protein